jgi:hypothetical protein
MGYKFKRDYVKIDSTKIRLGSGTFTNWLSQYSKIQNLLRKDKIAICPATDQSKGQNLKTRFIGLLFY